MTKAINVSQTANSTFAFKNRIINGGMVIDQRNAGASVTPAAEVVTYITDRFWAYQKQASKFTAQQNAGSVTPPVGFTNYLGITSSSAYSVVSTDQFFIAQSIEGFNTADLGFGTANAKAVTLSFQVYSSLTGTFAGCIQNYATTRSYPFTYTVSTANTWTSISITIPGDTSGTWVGATNGGSLNVIWSLGAGSTFQSTANTWASGNYKSVSGAVSVVGTNGATFYITGVQLEKGSVATDFDFRSYGQELALCQRYYEKSQNQNIAPGTPNENDGVFYAIVAGNTGSGNYGNCVNFAVTKRANVTFTTWDASGRLNKCNTDAQGQNQSLTVLFNGQNRVLTFVAGLSNPGALSFYWAASAEL